MHLGIALIVAALGISGCGFRHEKQPGGTAGAPTTAAPGNPFPSGETHAGGSTPTPTFATVRTRVLEPRCVRCHDELNDFPGAFAKRAEIRERVFATTDPKRRMPRGKPLTDEQAATLRAWLDAGAPENEAEPPGPPPASPLTPLAPTWIHVQEHFFARYCTSCHHAGSDESDLDLGDLQAVRGHAAKILDLVLVRHKMPPKPESGPATPLRLEDKRLLVDWIDAGMPGPEGPTTSCLDCAPTRLLQY